MEDAKKLPIPDPVFNILKADLANFIKAEREYQKSCSIAMLSVGALPGEAFILNIKEKCFEPAPKEKSGGTVMVDAKTAELAS